VHDDTESSGSWTMLTGHGHVLVEIARNPDARVRDLAESAGITERAVQGILTDLEAGGYITRRRKGRRSIYTVNRDRPFRHSAQDGYIIGPLLDLLAGPAKATTAPRPVRGARPPTAEPGPSPEPDASAHSGRAKSPRQTRRHQAMTAEHSASGPE
jgi:DNA-binding transcriptional ArsR family regulator